MPRRPNRRTRPEAPRSRSAGRSKVRIRGPRLVKEAARPVVAPPPESLSERERQHRAYALRLAGLDYRTIAEQLHIPISQAFQDVKFILDCLPVDGLRALYIQRLDYYLSRLQGGIESGDTQSIQTAVGVMKFQGQLSGILDDEGRDERQRPLRELTGEELSRLIERLHQQATRALPPAIDVEPIEINRNNGNGNNGNGNGES